MGVEVVRQDPFIGYVGHWDAEFDALVRDPDGGFDHPAVPPGHPVRPHVLYRFPDVTARRNEALQRAGGT